MNISNVLLLEEQNGFRKGQSSTDVLLLFPSTQFVVQIYHTFLAYFPYFEKIE
jgi:hypothetical protein